ncbi:hypothetical protein FRC10_004035, partial [Ceratobasidium sp. 414]
ALEAIATLALEDDIAQQQLFEKQVTSRVIALLRQKSFIPPGLQALAALAAY